MLTNIAYAQGQLAQNSNAATKLVQNIATQIVNPVILFLVALALLIFLWGLAEYIRGGDSSTSRDTGRKHMLWGIIGLFIMISAYAILNIAVNSVFGS